MTTFSASFVGAVAVAFFAAMIVLLAEVDGTSCRAIKVASTVIQFALLVLLIGATGFAAGWLFAGLFV